jgi:hypothetical protein
MFSLVTMYSINYQQKRMTSMNFKKTVLSAAVVTALSGTITAPAQADVLNFSWDGLFTILDSGGVPLGNTSLPYYYDPTWGYGLRTQISGTASFDTVSGSGSATVNPFDFYNGGPAVAHDISMQAIGDGLGGGGTLIAGKMLFDWNGNNNINVGIILDGAGMFGALPTLNVGDTISGVGAIPASNNIKKGKLPIGPAPMATTSFDTEYHNGGVLISGDDGIGGSPMDNGPFVGFSANFDMTSMTLASVVPAVPVPAAVWLFGSGLLGLVGVARRRKPA